MKESCSWSWRRTWLIGLIAALVLPGLGWVSSSTLLARANQSQVTEGPDIAAMVLTPQDLAGVGLDGYGLYRALFLASEEISTQIAEAGGLQAKSVQTVLTTAKFQEAYISTLARPSVMGDASSPWSHAVSVTLQRFADEAGSTLAFDLFRRPTSDPAPQVTLATPSASDARWTRSETTGSNGVPAVELHLDLRFGSLIAGLTILDETGGEPSMATAESLAGRLIERLAAGTSQNEAPLSWQAVTMPGQEFSLGGQFYRWLDGEAMVEYGVNPSIAESEAEFMARIGAEASFYVWQRMATGMPGPYDDTFFYSTVTRFNDAEAAAASLDNLLDQVRREGYQEVTEVTETLGLGDQEVVYIANTTWESRGTTYTFWYHVYTIRVGRITGNVMMIAPEPPSPGSVTALAQAQALCLQEGRCAARLSPIEELGGNEGLDFNPSEVHATPTTVTSQENIGVPLDLAAMALRPSDLEAEGLADYGVSLAIIGDAANAGGFLNAWRGDPNGETASGLLRANPLRAHFSYLALSERIGDDSSPTARQILSYIIEFENVAAAKTGFPILADAWSINGTSEVPGGAGIGEEQIVVSLTGQQPGSFAGYDRVDLLFRTGSLVAGISIENFTGDPPTVEEAERLSRQLLDRIDMVRAGNGPDLGSRAVRLSVPAWAQSWDADAYNIMNGEGLRRYGESEESLAQYQTGIEADQVLDYYFIAQQLNRLTDGDYRSYFNGIRRFATSEAAATFLADLNNRLERNNFTNVTIDESVPTFGDTSTAITYQRQVGGQTIQGARITMQLGDLLASVELSGQDVPPMALLEQLMTVQLDCLTTDSCPMSLPLPVELST